MSVLITLRVPGNARLLEEHAAASPDTMKRIVSLANSHGLISHRFYGNDTELLVVDEWESEEGFRTFFAEAGGQIGPMMASAGVTSEPEVTCWRKLETGDDV